MKRILLLFVSVFILAGASFAKEGMWLPILLQILNEKEMQEMGLELTAEDIYSVNHSSLKDAVLIFGGGCTGEVVSNEGLLFTNYHCGYGSIQRQSSIDHDYLTDGFWAMNKGEEIPCPGLTVSFLIEMRDVTEAMLSEINDNMTQAEREDRIRINSKKLTEEAMADNHYKAEVEEFYYGNKYYIFIYEIFNDIRLVGAPPSNIGKFGGDTDNWMWPRHTGDFSVFRIYAGSDNKPAVYSPENKPFQPRKFLEISIAGVKENDFTFVFGYPGSTNEYLPAPAVECITEIENPISIDIREKKLDVMNAYSEQSPLIRLQYANKIAGIANGWKKWIGESLGIERVNGAEVKREYEKGFQQWATGTEYENILPTLYQSYKNIKPFRAAYRYFAEAGLGIEAVTMARKFAKLVSLSKETPQDTEAIEKQIASLKSAAKTFFKDYHRPIDEELCPILLKTYYDNTSAELMPDFFAKIEVKYKGDFTAYAGDIFAKSMFCDEAKLNAFLDSYKPNKYKKILDDPMYVIYNSVFDNYIDNVYPHIKKYQAEIDSTMRFYMKGQIEYDKEKTFYPDANFTLRVTYGNVDGFKPKDGVTYNYFTTLDGIMEKENPDIYDYVVEDKLKELYNNRDFGPYADKSDGKIHTCFIATNHTTGGNSGSPVLNGKGQLIGLNFDRNWQGTMSDIMYDPDRCRNITLDIRYCLFIIDKFAGATHLIQELTINN